jgi:glucose repression regulatory protein TUP1
MLIYDSIVTSSRSANPVKPGAGPLTANLAQGPEAFGDMNPESVPANLKIEGSDWWA